MSPRLPLLGPVLLIGLAASACAGGADADTASPGLSATGEAAEVALSIDTVSAWPNLHVSGTPSLPELVIRGDGTFHAVTYVDGEAALRTGAIPAASLDDLLDDVAALPRSGYGDPGLDGSTTTIHLDHGSGIATPREVSVWVPGEVDSYEGRARANRIAFNDVLEQADDLAREHGDEWTPDTWFLLSEEQWQRPDDPVPGAWPVHGVDPAGAVTDGFGCQVVGPEDAEAVRRAQEAEHPHVHGWVHDGAVYDVQLLPVLPGVTCADLHPYAYRAG